jgi:hypothetical protein
MVQFEGTKGSDMRKSNGAKQRELEKNKGNLNGATRNGAFLRNYYGATRSVEGN